MPYFKDQSGGWHFLSDEDIANGGMELLPAGCSERPAAEFDAWQVAQTSQKPATPAVVTMKQAQLALLAAGKLDAVDALVATQARAVQVVWATSGTVERANPLVASIGAALGLSDAQIDTLFEQAAKL